MARKKKPQNLEGHCDICGYPYIGYFSAYQHTKWLDGKKHQEICFICGSVPKAIVIDDMYEICGSFAEPVKLNTLSEMMADGFSREEAIASIKSVGKAIGLSYAKIKKLLNSTPLLEAKKEPLSKPPKIPPKRLISGKEAT